MQPTRSLAPSERASRTLRQKSFFRSRTIGNARETLESIQDGAELGDENAARHVASVGLAVAKAVRKPKIQEALLTHTLQVIEDGVSGSVGYLSSFASSLRDPLDDMKIKPEDARAVRLAAVNALAEEAPDAGIAEAPYLGFLAMLATLDPGGALNMSTRIGLGRCGDLNRPGWLAVVASGMVHSGEFDRDQSRVTRALDIALPEIRKVSTERKDEVALAHLERMDRYAKLPLSEEGQRALQSATLHVLAEGYPDEASTAVALSKNFTLHGHEPQDREVMKEAAWSEIQASGSTESKEAWFSHRRADSLRGRARALKYLENAKWAKENGVPLHLQSVRTELGRALRSLESNEFANLDLQSFWAGILAIERPPTIEDRLQIGLDLASQIRNPEFRQNLLLQMVRDLEAHWQDDEIGLAYLDDLSARVRKAPDAESRAEILESGLGHMMTLKKQFDRLLGAEPKEAPVIIEADIDSLVVGDVVLEVLD